MTRRPLRAVDVRASAVFPFAALSRRHVVFAQFAPVDVTRRERLGGRPNRSHGDERAIVDVDVARGVGSRRHRRWARAGEAPEITTRARERGQSATLGALAARVRAEMASARVHGVV